MTELSIFKRMAVALLKRWPQGKWAARINEFSTGLGGHLPDGAWVVVRAEWEQAGAPKGLHATAECDGFNCCRRFEAEVQVVQAVEACERAIRAAFVEGGH